MIKWIKTWTESIIIAVIISIIIEMLLPDGKNKKYIKVVSGIYILYTIINPFFGSNINLEKIDFGIQLTNNTISSNSSDTIAETYISSLEEYFKEKIVELGYEVKDIKIICNFDYSIILSIAIKMKSLNYDVDSIKNLILQEYQIDADNIVIS